MGSLRIFMKILEDTDSWSLKRFRVAWPMDVLVLLELIESKERSRIHLTVIT